MTPTPEDIALANKIEERAWCPAHLDNIETARLIAAHCAPLRERIAALEQELNELNTGKRVVLPVDRKHAEAMVRVAGGLVNTESARELAEIGRLAVEMVRKREIFDNAPSSDDSEAMNELITADMDMLAACAAYLAKQKEPKP